MKTLDLVFYIWYLLTSIAYWIVAVVCPPRWDCILLGSFCFGISMIFRHDYFIQKAKRRS
jgi:hypothetical protein